jgi:hypothetical protein
MRFRLSTLVWLSILGPPVLACPWWLPQLAGMAFMLAVSLVAIALYLVAILAIALVVDWMAQAVSYWERPQ